MEFSEVINARRSIEYYEANHDITNAELRALFDQVVLSPSSFNLQHWRFVAVREPAHKAQLRKAAFDQEQVDVTLSPGVSSVNSATSLIRLYSPASN